MESGYIRWVEVFHFSPSHNSHQLFFTTIRSTPSNFKAKMKYSVAFAAAAASMVSADYTRCGTVTPSAEHIAMTNAMVEEAQNKTFSIQALRNVDTYVHVVTTSSKAGRYSQSMVNEQVCFSVQSSPGPIADPLDCRDERSIRSTRCRIQPAGYHLHHQ